MTWTLIIALCATLDPDKRDCVPVFGAPMRVEQAVCRERAAALVPFFKPSIALPHVVAACLPGEHGA